jgi:hypothetical protein
MTDLTGHEATVTPDVPTEHEETQAIEAAVEHGRVDLPAVIKETKAGYKTTEFWVAIVSLVIVNLNGVVMTLPDKYQAIATAAIAAFYAVARGQAKSGVPALEPDVPS